MKMVLLVHAVTLLMSICYISIRLEEWMILIKQSNILRIYEIPNDPCGVMIVIALSCTINLSEAFIKIRFH